MTTSQIQRAADFVWLTGRALDQRRMEYFTGAADARGVLLALDGYSTGDGGYAYGLEPDIKGPLAHPLTVMTALRLLDEVDMLDAGRAEPLTRWLGRHVAPDGGIPALLETIRDHPRPPWIAPPDRPVGGLLPTARIVGLLLKHGITAPWLEAAIAFCWNALDTMHATHPYEVHSSVVYLDHAPDRHRAVKAAAHLGELVREQELFLADPHHPERGRVAPGYAASEFHYAHDFATTPDSLAARWFTEAELTAGLDHLAAAQQADGGWQINWRRWAPTTESEARPGVTIEKLRILRAWNRLSR
ncbi:MAG: hypothetical protein HOV79_24995 [Hamadaea sp.]|nr:hypothetical protein [Hamadaea sp.]